MVHNRKELIHSMTLEEKAGMCSGMDFWHTKGIDRLSIPSIMVSDGPHGLRKQDDKADHLGINNSIQTVCYPTACATAASFDRNLLMEMGTALGKECQAEGVSVLLGPGVNMKRSPLCGRNFEYFSEDPYLAGQLGVSFVNGVQSQGVGTSLKHFAANNQEHLRMTISAEIEEQTLRELYLSAFETIVKEAKPWTVMCSYNRLNGELASENEELLTHILREEWGYEGMVVSDWGAVNDRVKGLQAGLDLEMPASNWINDKKIVEAVKNGDLKEEVLDTAVERILQVVDQYLEYKRTEVINREENHLLAARIEEESAALLKNEEEILPLSRGSKIAVIGEFAQKPRFQGGGSSHINSFRISSALEEIRSYAEVTYVKGFSTTDEEITDEELKNAIEASKNAEVVVIFAGLPDSYESEGYDRVHMHLPQCQEKLIEAIAKVNTEVIVVLHHGSPIEMPWANQVKGILDLFLGGEAVGIATSRLLFGLSNPCGRLPETYPLRLEHNPSHLNFPGDWKKVEYKEGLFIGYRYYDKKQMEVQYPFGHGLSYTTFSYEDLKTDKDCMTEEEFLQVSIKVTNTGMVAGKEVVQLYVANKTNYSVRPIRELKEFTKVLLQPGESKVVTFTLKKRSFALYEPKLKDWFCPSGHYSIQIGKNSRDIILEKDIELQSSKEIPMELTMDTTVGELLHLPKTREFILQMVEKFQVKFTGESEVANEAITGEMMLRMFEYAPIRNIRNTLSLSEEEMDQMFLMIQQLLS